MEYKKLTNDYFPSCLTKISIVFGLVLSIFMWFILFFCLYKLNNKITILQAEQEELMNKILIPPEFVSGYSTEQDLYDYYEYPSLNEDGDRVDLLEENSDDFGDMLRGGGAHTKDGLESRRLKRDIVGRTPDGVPVNSESYAEVKRKNRTRAKQGYLGLRSTTSAPTPSNVQATARSSKSTVIYSKSRVMHNSKPKGRRRILRRPMLKSLSNNSPDQTVSSDLTVVQGIPHRRRHRQRRVGSSSMLRPTIHMHGHISSSEPSNYLGNGRMHHYTDHFKNWTRDYWVENLGMDDYFQLDDGHLRFLDSGLYYVYAQIYYADEHDTNGFRVLKNEEVVLQCTTTTHTNHRMIKSNSCYTGGVIAVTNGDVLRVHDIEANRYSIFQKGKSFFGAMKLGEVRET